MKISEKFKFLKKVWGFLNSRIFVVILIILLIFFVISEFQRIMKLNRTINQNEQNISALTDTLKYERTKKGELLVSIDGYIATEKNLKKLNKELYNKIQSQNGKILSLTNTIISVKLDSIELAKTIDKLNVVIGEFYQIEKDKYLTKWSIPNKFDDNNFFIIDGSTSVQVLSVEPFKIKHDTTYLTKFHNQIDVTYGLKIENNKLRVYILSNYPGFTVKSMEGVLIDPNDWPNIYKPKKRHWFTGFGVGPNISMSRGFLNNTTDISIGVGIHYNIYQW